MPADWLPRLSTATDYKQLQSVFAEIVTDAYDGMAGPELAEAIDEAVRRLEQERARDEKELAEIQSRYDGFRQQNQGVVGWFKRHIPFTDTRRQELAHRGDVADQQAELLADNLVIARAQMIKERFTSERTLGLRPAQWKSRLDGRDRLEDLAGLAAVAIDLATELVRSQRFLEELERDINAFADAKFKTAEDCQRRDKDLIDARSELAELSNEVLAETEIKKTALKQVATQVHAELTARDSGFRADAERLENLKEIRTRLEESRTAVGQLSGASLAVGRLLQEMQGLPAEIKRLKAEAEKLERERNDVSVQAAKKQALVEERQTRYDQLRRERDEAQQALKTAKQFHEAWQAERAQSAAAPAEDPTSPVLRQFHQAQNNASEAETRFKEVSGPYETARKDAEDFKSSVDAVGTKLKEARERLATLESRTPALERELARERELGRTAHEATARTVKAYIEAARKLGSTVELRSDDFSGGGHNWFTPDSLASSLSDALFGVDGAHHLSASQAVERLVKWHELRRTAHDQDHSSVRKRREAAWRRRCRELLGDPLTEEACAGGL